MLSLEVGSKYDFTEVLEQNMCATTPGAIVHKITGISATGRLFLLGPPPITRSFTYVTDKLWRSAHGFFFCHIRQCFCTYIAHLNKHWHCQLCPIHCLQNTSICQNDSCLLVSSETRLEPQFLHLLSTLSPGLGCHWRCSGMSLLVFPRLSDLLVWSLNLGKLQCSKKGLNYDNKNAY